MDVLHITEACGAGVRRHLGLVLPRLQASGVSCGLLAFGSRFEDGFEEEFKSYNLSGVWIDRCALPRPLVLVREACRISRICDECHPRIIHCHAFAAGVAGRLFSHSGSSLVYSPHAFSVGASVPFARRTIARIAENFLKSRTDGFAFVGQGEVGDADYLQIPPEKRTMVMNALPAEILDEFLNRDEARRRLGIPENEIAAVALCRLEAQKGLDYLIETWSMLAPGKVLYVFGNGPDREKLSRAIAQKGLEGHVRLMGGVPEIRRSLRAFDVGILPSRYEGLSYALLEMLAAGIPVAASAIPANDIGHGVRLFPLDDPKETAAVIEEAIAAGASEGQIAFDLDEQVSALRKLYDKLAGEPSR